MPVQQEARRETLQRLGAWTPQRALDAALALARGSYQRDCLLGRRRWSGADLRGRAAEYGGRYASSRWALMARIRTAGVPLCVRAHGSHGKLTLLYEAPDASLVPLEEALSVEVAS